MRTLRLAMIWIGLTAPLAGLHAQATSARWRCKDNTVASTEEGCASHGGADAKVFAAKAKQTKLGTVVASCKDGTRYFYTDSTTCSKAGGVSFTFPGEALSAAERAEIQARTDSVLPAAKCKDGSTSRAPLADLCDAHGGVAEMIKRKP